MTVVYHIDYGLPSTPSICVCSSRTQVPFLLYGIYLLHCVFCEWDIPEMFAIVYPFAYVVCMRIQPMLNAVTVYLFVLTSLVLSTECLTDPSHCDDTLPRLFWYRFQL